MKTSIGDVNDDTFEDIVVFGQNNVWVSLSNGVDGFLPKKSWKVAEYVSNVNWKAQHPRMVAEVNDDGSADIVAFGDHDVWVSLSNGVDGFGNGQVWYHCYGRGSTFLGRYTGGWDSDNHRIAKDVTGDNRADIVGYGDKGDVWVTTSKF